MLGALGMLGIDDMLRLSSRPLDTPAELSPVEKDAPGQQPTVLVVDDDRAVREVLSAVLRGEGRPRRQAGNAGPPRPRPRGGGRPLAARDGEVPERGRPRRLAPAPPR